MVLFAAVQIADAYLTLAGIARFGAAIEANPVLSASVALIGPDVTLWGAKVFAILCGTALYKVGHHLALTLLTILYVFGALIPWSVILFG